MMDLTTILQSACSDATEDEISEHMKELRKVQSSLKKAFDHKKELLSSIPQTLRASSPENLSPQEIEIIVQEIATDKSYEADPMISVPQKPDESCCLSELATVEIDSPPSIVSNSRSSSPILAGLDTYK